MGDTALPTSPLATAATAFAAALGDRLPAAFGLVTGPVRLAGQPADHPVPDDAVAVRWVLGQDEAAIAVAVGRDAAEMLQQGPPVQDLVTALTPRVQAALAHLAPLFGGTVPTLGEGAEVDPALALADGPGDLVSVPLDDAGTHRATTSLRLVVGDDLLAPTAETDPPADAADAQAADTPAGGAPGAEPPAGPALQAVAQAPLAPAPVLAGSPSVTGGARSRGGAARPAPVAAIGQEAHPAQFASFDQLSALPAAAHSMAMLGEVEMGVTAELGRTRLTVRDVLGLSPGSIIELDRAAGSPVDVVVNGTLIARGEVVVIDEEFGVRITEIMGMSEADQPMGLQVAQ